MRLVSKKQTIVNLEKMNLTKPVRNQSVWRSEENNRSEEYNRKRRSKFENFFKYVDKALSTFLFAINNWMLFAHKNLGK